MQKALKISGRIAGLVLAVVGLVTLPDDLQDWRNVLSGDFLSWALIILGVLVFSAAVFAERLRPYVGKSTLHIKGRTLDARDLYSMGGGTVRVEGRTFEQCTFMGPLIILLNSTELTEGNKIAFRNQFEKEGVLWPVPEGVRLVEGIIELKDCRIKDCTFRLVGFAVNKEQAKTMRESFGI